VTGSRVRVRAAMGLRLGSPAALLWSVLLAGAAGGAVQGCGSSSSGNGVAAKSPAEIVAASRAAADAASSVHVSGSIVSSGSPLTLDMDMLAGRGGRGRLSQNGFGFELIQVGQTVYIKGSAAFYSHLGGAAAAQLLQGRWLKAPTTSRNFASIAALTDFRQLIDTALTRHGALLKGATTTVDGQKVIAISETSKGGILYVATSGRPYPIEVSKIGASGGTVVFDRWQEPVSLAAPANAIDITQLQGH
jgi:hypothetical protein